MTDSNLSRRQVLGMAGMGGVAALLAACAPSAKWLDGAGSPSPGDTGGSGGPTTPPPPSGAPVHVRLYQSDGSTWGVGMPIIAYLSTKITDGRPFAAATTVTVNGQPAQGAWFFQDSAIYPDYPIEAHYRTQQYWPAHAQIHLSLATQGKSAGPGFVFDNSLTLDISTGKANISRIDGNTERMVVTSDNSQVFDFPVSLGQASTPTFSGVKVVMELDKVQRMVNTTPGQEYDLEVPWSVRLTNSGEFIHSASWNGGNIGVRSTSHGCTNLTVTDAESFFNFAQLGDVAEYTNTGGETMPNWDGYGDWNLPWATWQAGGLVPTT
jgi:lipoprotein-anchoring transpeptidase ErfK/SrfK